MSGRNELNNPVFGYPVDMKRVLAGDRFGLLPAAGVAQDNSARAGYLSSRYNEVPGCIESVQILPVCRQKALYFIEPFYILYNKKR